MLTHPTNSTDPSKTIAVSDNCCKYLALRKCAALDLCEKFKISLPSAYRHLAKGTTPASIRRVGKDGRWYPAGQPKVEPVNRDLKLAWSALNRARQSNANDLDVIQRIWGLAAVMLEEAT